MLLSLSLLPWSVDGTKIADLSFEQATLTRYRIWCLLRGPYSCHSFVATRREPTRFERLCSSMSRLSSRRRAGVSALALSLVPLIARGVLRLVPFVLLAGVSLYTAKPASAQLQANTNYNGQNLTGYNANGVC